MHSPCSQLTGSTSYDIQVKFYNFQLSMWATNKVRQRVCV
jgi:hypothetical protein